MKSRMFGWQRIVLLAALLPAAGAAQGTPGRPLPRTPGSRSLVPTGSVQPNSVQPSSVQPTSAQPGSVQLLREGWQLASACDDKDPLETISTTSYSPRNWIATPVPSTVLAAQLASGSFDSLAGTPGVALSTGTRFDPFFGMNLRRIPGTDYPIGTFYSNQQIPPGSPYICGWLYRRSFATPAIPGQHTFLRFGGINYRGELWVNGRRVAGQSDIAGAYRRYEFDVTDFVHPGDGNVVVVETFAPGAKDLGINWVDWNPCPADKDMGLWGEVAVVTSGAVTVRSPAVTTHFADDTLRSADLTVTALLANHGITPVRGHLRGRLTGVRTPVAFSVPVTLAAGEEKELLLTRSELPELHIEQPEVWWPYGLGSQHLNRIDLSFTVEGSPDANVTEIPTDTASARFGIREASSELDALGHRLFRINRHPILIRGGGWSPDMLLRESPERMREQFKLVRDLHLNTLRLEGKLETEQFFDLADEQGVLVMAGWCCCDHWEHWKDWTATDLEIATASLRAQLLRLRSHSSLLVWLNGSDGPPPANVESAYLQVEKETRWPNAIISSASATPTLPTGKSGVKMLGPYDYVVPSYWLRDQVKAGGAYGFNTETSPGPAVPDVAELQRFLPPDKLWPINSTWDYHTGGGKYKSLAVINRAMANIYGPPGGLEDYTRTADAMQYDAERAMFEAYGRNKYTSTGVVQWMLNNAWPSLIWHLYDFYLQPGAGYYGAKKANEPVHVQYGYDDRGVAVVNSLFTPVSGLHASADVYGTDGKLLWHGEGRADVAADAVVRVLTVPAALLHPDALVLVRLRLRNNAGKSLGTNDYWVSGTETEFDWPKTDYTHTEPSVFESLAGLRRLPLASVATRMLPPTAREPVRLELHNTSGAIASEITMESRRADGTPYDALMWSDNYVILMPGERRVLTATPLDPGTSAALSAIQVSGWNIPPTTISVQQRTMSQRSGHSPPTADGSEETIR